MGKMLMEVRKVLRERREGEEKGRLDKILAQYVQEDREREEQEYSEKVCDDLRGNSSVCCVCVFILVFFSVLCREELLRVRSDD